MRFPRWGKLNSHMEKAPQVKRARQTHSRADMSVQRSQQAHRENKKTIELLRAQVVLGEITQV